MIVKHLLSVAAGARRNKWREVGCRSSGFPTSKSGGTNKVGDGGEAPAWEAPALEVLLYSI